jgi:hypothetical protein
MKNESVKERFQELMESCIEKLNKEYDGEILYYYNNPNNIMNGCTIGIRTSE